MVCSDHITDRLVRETENTFNNSSQFFKHVFFVTRVFFCSFSKNLWDEVAEWLRRWTANPMGSARVGSNPILVVKLLLIILLLNSV